MASVKTITFLIAIFAVQVVMGQTVDEMTVSELPRSGAETVTETTPAAQSMRKYVDFPVSYATGTTNVSIPLVELPGGSVSVKLGLSYHTGGIKASDVSSGIGLGWSLTGLGSISRQINGFPDEWRGYVGSQNLDFKVDTGTDNLDYFISILSGETDSEYDLYSFEFPGYAGYFIIDDGVVKQLPQTDLDIKIISNAKNDKAIDAFVVTTPEGVEYRFEETESIEYQYDLDPTAINRINWGYEAITSWNLTKIVSPEQIDNITIDYETATEWGRNYKLSQSDFNYKFYKSGGASNAIEMRDILGTHYTKFTSPKIPKTIKSRSGRIEFDIKRKAYDFSTMPNDIIEGLRLYDSDGNQITAIDFENNGTFSDYRQILEKVSIVKDGITVDSYKLRYKRSGGAGISDIFGYPGGSVTGNKSSSVLDTDLELSDARKPGSGIYANLLDTIVDIKGMVTALIYEPATVTVPDSTGSIFKGDVIVGPRLKAIVTGDSTKVRSFQYADSVCSIDLSKLRYDMFMYNTGLVSVRNLLGQKTYYNYELNTFLTSSSRTRGCPVEQARVYYGKVTELVTGDGIEMPVKTVYEYDLSNCVNRYFDKGGKAGAGSKALSLPPDGMLNMPIDDKANKIIGPHPTRGYFQRNYSGGPLLKRVTSFEHRGNDYKPLDEKLYFYSSTDSLTVIDGVFCESNVYRARINDPFYPEGSSSLNVDALTDVNSFLTDITCKRMLCDSIHSTTFYPDGNKRTVRMRYQYAGTPIWGKLFRNNRFEIIDTINKDDLLVLKAVRFPGFDSDTITAPYYAKSFYPLTTTISCGNESRTFYDVRSEFAGKIFKDDNDKVRLKRQPVIERVVMQKGNAKDTVTIQYEYGKFNCSGKTAIRPVHVYQYNGNSKKLAASKHYHSYDGLGRLLEMTDESGRKISATWLPQHDLYSSISMPGVNLTYNYEYAPMVGCTSISFPNGRTRNYTYTAGRLSQESNSDNEPLLSYGYQLAMESGLPKENYTTRTLHADGGTVTDTTYYDSRGLPTLMVEPAAGGSYVATNVTYDALGRVVRQYLPVPQNLRNIGTVSGYYNDNAPYTKVKYRWSASDRPVEIAKAGSKMSMHPARFDYLCSSGSVAMLQCRRYRLSQADDKEEITLDGQYGGGELDAVKATDPDGCISIQFKDWLGNIVLERRVADDNTFADTYYLYDAAGRVRVILQPEGAAKMTRKGKTWTLADPEIEQFAFIYRYDRRGNCNYFKQPGAGAALMRHDRHNREVFRATAEMQGLGMCEFKLYDAAGRTAVSGISHSPLPGADVDIPAMVTSYSDTGSGIDGTGYQLPAGVSLGDAEVTVAHYYDDYRFVQREGFSGLPAGDLDLNSVRAKGLLAGSRISMLRNGYTGDNKYAYTINEYDTDCRVTARVETTAIADTHMKSSFTYDRQGKVTRTETSLHTPDSVYTVTSTDSLDLLGNPVSRSTQSSIAGADGKSSSQAATYDEYFVYTPLGQLSKVMNSPYGTPVAEYGYNLRGQLSSVSNPAFTQILKYEDGDAPCCNGNISQMILSYNGQQPVTRSFKYDKLDRLTAMESTDGFNTSYTYNLNSSPLTIRRHGIKSNGTTGLVDDIMLVYDGNRLSKAQDSADPVLLENSLDFYRNAEYSYDADGRMTEDTGRGITVGYNDINKPEIVVTDNGMFDYTYSALGRKTVERYMTETGVANSIRYYIGPFELENTGPSKVSVSRINTSFGWFDGRVNAYRNFLDYQGNVRSVMKSGETNPVQTTDYYPYGMPMATSTGAAANRYKYSSKELETRDGTNLYDFEARMLLADVCLMNGPDSKSAEYPSLNPFLYCAANPLKYTDPTGELISANDKGNTIYFDLDANNELYVYDKDGKIIEYSNLTYFNRILYDELEFLLKTKVGFSVISKIMQFNGIIKIISCYKKVNDNGIALNFNFYDDNKKEINWLINEYNGGLSFNPITFEYTQITQRYITLFHELSHGYDSLKGTFSNSQEFLSAYRFPYPELFACCMENQLRGELKEPMRVGYGVTKIGSLYLNMTPLPFWVIEAYYKYY